MCERVWAETVFFTLKEILDIFHVGVYCIVLCRSVSAGVETSSICPLTLGDLGGALFSTLLAVAF